MVFGDHYRDSRYCGYRLYDETEVTKQEQLLT
jgi:hypothetical protein